MLHLTLADEQCVFREHGPNGQQLRSAQLAGCRVGALKKPRKSRLYAFRVDLESADSSVGGDKKYVLSVEDEGSLRLWMDAFGGCSSMCDAELAAAQEAAAQGVGKKQADKAEKRAHKQLRKASRRVLRAGRSGAAVAEEAEPEPEPQTETEIEAEPEEPELVLVGSHSTRIFPLWKGLPDRGRCKQCQEKRWGPKSGRYCQRCFLCGTCCAETTRCEAELEAGEERSADG